MASHSRTSRVTKLATIELVNSPISSSIKRSPGLRVATLMVLPSTLNGTTSSLVATLGETSRATSAVTLASSTFDTVLAE